MAKGVSSASSSRKVCPANKFSIMSGCMTWAMALGLIALGALLIMCILIMTQRPRGVKKNDILEEHRRRSGPQMILDGNLSGNLDVDFTMDPDGGFEPNDLMRSPHDGTGTVTSDRIKYTINVNNRDVNPERPNLNMISYDQYEANKNMERIVNPLLPPERSYQNTYGTPINIPSRGPMQSYQQVGIMYKENIENTDKQPGNNTDSNVLPLYGRPTFNGSNKWNYYTASDKFQNFKLPISCDGRKCDDDLGCNELRSGDMLTIPSYNGRFRVEIYGFDKPRYIPYVY